ncbi:MAG: hypothetical protein LQ342_005704 [Letrouitia transgressa]|nr:MAG: hypothetical protein LQ342_005704 [Letrouitia transgressa]
MGSNYYYGIDRRATFSGGEYPPPPNFQLPRDLPDPYQLPPKLPNPKNYPLKPPPIPPTYADSNRFPPPRHIPARYDYGYGDDKYDTDGYSGGQEVFTKSQSQRSRSAPNRIPLPRIIPSDTDYRRRPDEFTDPMQDAYNLYKKDCEKKQNAAKNYNRMPGANTRSKDANLEAAAWNVANMANV